MAFNVCRCVLWKYGHRHSANIIQSGPEFLLTRNSDVEKKGDIRDAALRELKVSKNSFDCAWIEAIEQTGRYDWYKPITPKTARQKLTASPPLTRLGRKPPTAFEAAKHFVGVVILLLTAALLLTPVPLSNIAPATVIALVALAYLEEDGLLLCFAFVAAVVLISVASAAVWGAIVGAALISRIW